MIYYLGWYKSQHVDDFTKNGNNAATFKMGYVIRKCKELGESVTVVSCCLSDKQGYVPLRRVEVDNLQTEDYLPSLRLKGVFRKFIPYFRSRYLLKYLKNNLKKEDTLIVYHALGLEEVLKKAKKKIGFNLVLEIEEIYHVDTKCKNPQKAKKDEQKLINLADKYIIVNDLIYDKYVANGKPFVVLYGVYDQEYDTKKETKTSKQILFSGSLDLVRGVMLALEAAKFLPKEYCLNVCGSGNSSFVDELKEKIIEHNESKKGCEIIFHGELTNAELEKLVCSCEIGLNLQDVNNPFEAVSFPSKITFYLLHGLNVVSTKMSSVLASSFNDCVSFSDDSPEDVAKTIMEMKLLAEEFIRRKMKMLDESAKTELKKLLG